MDKDNQATIEIIIQLRRQLAALEKKRAQYGQEVPGDLWNDIVDLCRRIDRQEQKIFEVSKRISKQVNESREGIVEKLEEYQHWREQMREFESLFLAYIVRPGYRLKQAVRQREHLSEEYRRMQSAIDAVKYASLEELSREIKQVLLYNDTAFAGDKESLEDEVLEEKNLYEGLIEFDVDDLVEEFQKEDLVRDFKRHVLPAVHPDTSDATRDEFKTAFEVYERRDYLLMEAYIAQYKGAVEIDADAEKDPIELLDELEAGQARYNRLNERLTRRIEHLKKEMHPQELESPDELREKFRTQREEIRNRIQEESEKILQLRKKIEGLSQYYIDHQAN
jgi:hypothetical protein